MEETNAARTQVNDVNKSLFLYLFVVIALLAACKDEGRKHGSRDTAGPKAENLQNSFTKPIVKIPHAGSNTYHLFGIKDCHVYQASQTQHTITGWQLLFKPAPYLLPKVCIVERLEMQNGYLHIEIGTQAIGAGGCCTTYAAYRSRDGETWEIRPATSIKTWQPLEVED